MRFLYLTRPVSFLAQAMLLLHVHTILGFQSSCAKEYVSSSLAVMTAGVTSGFTITATDYPGNPCNLGSEMFGFNLLSSSSHSFISARFNSQWSVTPPNQFEIPLAITSSGTYSVEVVRFGTSGVFEFGHNGICYSADSCEQGVVLTQHITRIRFWVSRLRSQG
jgi:hypothetical protein